MLLKRLFKNSSAKNTLAPLRYHSGPTYRSFNYERTNLPIVEEEKNKCS